MPRTRKGSAATGQKATGDQKPKAGPAGLLCAYAAIGTDEARRKEVVRRLKARLDPGMAAFNLDERAASADMDPGGLVASLNTLPVGSAFRLVVVTGADHLPKAVSEAIVSYLDNPNPGCVLLLVADSLSKGTRLYKAVARQGKSSIIECAAKKAWELPGYLAKRSAARGMPIDVDAAQELVERVGESTLMLDRQVSSLWELCGQNGRITLADVQDHVARTAEVKPWGFLDAVCNRDATKALTLYNLMRNPSEIALLALLGGRIRELICAKSLDARGEGALLAKELGKQGWQVKNHLRWARRFQPGQLERCLMDCAACDAALKSGANPRTSFTRLVLRVCGVA